MRDICLFHVDKTYYKSDGGTGLNFKATFSRFLSAISLSLSCFVCDS